MASRFLNNITVNDSYTLPSADGDADQIIQTDGAGNLSFVDLSSIEGAASNFVYFEVKNETGSTINKGKGVMAVGTDGNSGHILIDEMIADGSVESKYFLGVLETTIANGGFARVISFGQLDKFNTLGQNGETWSDGQVLWCDPDSAGDFTITEPDGPNVKIAAAIILNAATNGKIQVRVQANEGIHDLYDTKIASQVDGDVLVWDNTTGVWFNDSTLNVDYTAGNVGIGTTDPGANLEVVGESGVIIDSGTSAQAKLTLIGDGSSYGGGAIIDVIGGSSDYTTYGLNIKRSPNVMEAFNLYNMGNARWTWDGNIGATRSQPYTSYDFKSQGSSQMVIYNNNVGIGTNNPTAKTHIEQIIANGTIAYPLKVDVMPPGSNASGDGTGISFGIGNNVNNRKEQARITVKQNYYGVRPSMSFDTTDYNSPYTDFISRILIDPQGNVGIGTTNPITSLTLGTGSSGISFQSSSTTLNSGKIAVIKQVEVGNGNGHLAFETYQGGSGGGERMRIEGGGNVGINQTNPSEKLEVGGNIRTTNATVTQGSTVTFSGGGTTYETLGTNVAFARGTNGAMYNPILNPGGWSYAGRSQAPLGLLFNTDGWSDLSNVQLRDYQNFVLSLGGSVGNNIIDTELIMWDYINDNYYKLKFTAWGQGGVGGYTYQRTPLTINNKRSIATDTIGANKITVGDKVDFQAGINLYSNVDMASPSLDTYSELLVNPTAQNIRMSTDSLSASETQKVTGEYSVAVGHNIAKNSGSGTKKLTHNVLIGTSVANASTNVDTGSLFNVMIGSNAGFNLGQGSANGNISVGAYALRNIQGGDYNVTVGYLAGYNTTSGSYNTFLGRSAGDLLTTGTNNTCVGYNADVASNSTSNTITLGNSSITTLRCQVTSITSLSDKRDKANIKPSTYGLDLVNKLKPVTFDWNMRDKGKVGDKDLGFIAQDLKEVDDESLKLVYDENPEKLEASYGRLIPVMAKAIQELSAKVDELSKKIQTLENK